VGVRAAGGADVVARLRADLVPPGQGAPGRQGAKGPPQLARQVCWDCKKQGHMRGAPECEYAKKEKAPPPPKKKPLAKGSGDPTVLLGGPVQLGFKVSAQGLAEAAAYKKDKKGQTSPAKDGAEVARSRASKERAKAQPYPPSKFQPPTGKPKSDAQRAAEAKLEADKQKNLAQLEAWRKKHKEKEEKAAADEKAAAEEAKKKTAAAAKARKVAKAIRKKAEKKKRQGKEAVIRKKAEKEKKEPGKGGGDPEQLAAAQAAVAVAEAKRKAEKQKKRCPGRCSYTNPDDPHKCAWCQLRKPSCAEGEHRWEGTKCRECGRAKKKSGCANRSKVREAAATRPAPERHRVEANLERLKRGRSRSRVREESGAAKRSKVREAAATRPVREQRRIEAKLERLHRGVNTDRGEEYRTRRRAP
jgi:hypothetical protein